MNITIDGIEYERIPTKPSKNKGSIKSLLTLMMASQAMFGMGSGPRMPKMPAVDIPSEFALIQQKKSKLSRSEREMVIDAFNRMYRKVKTDG